MQKWFNSQFLFGDSAFDFDQLTKILKNQFVLRVTQVHGSDGLVINKNFNFKNYKLIEADFIITDQADILLSVLTADCLPIFLYDPVARAIGAVHAGWRGSVLGVLDNAIVLMKKEFKTEAKHLQLLFGPCAKNCCYQVKSDCIETMKQFDSTKILENALVVKDLLTYFDLCLYNVMRAYNMGVLRYNIFTDFSVCTMCASNFFSCRKQGEKTGRNINGIMLI